MRIRNEFTTGPVFWRMFNPGDRLFWAGLSQGVVQPGQDIGPLSHASGSFKLELRRGDLFGPFLAAAGPVYANGQEWVLRSDGRLEPDAPVVVPPPSLSVSQRVPGYDPARDSFAFVNSFPFSSFPVQDIAGFRLTDTGYGLCGGMVYAVVDYHLSGVPLPSQAEPPTGGVLFDFLWRRLLDSFNLPFGPGAPARYIQLMSPALADAGPPVGIGVHSRMGELVTLEWPAIRAEIDAGRLCPIALVLHKTPDPGMIFSNHQVLVHGYQIDGPSVRLFISDPNSPRREHCLDFRTDNINVHAISYDGPLNPGARPWAVFRTAYSFANPPEVRGPGWDSGWRSLGRISLGGPDVASMNPAHLAVVSRGLDSAIWISETVGGVWTAPVSLGGVLTSDPSIVSWGDNRLDIFARGTDGALWHVWRDGPPGSPWAAWESLGGAIIGGPDAGSMGPGHLDVYVRGTDNAVHHRWFNGGWSGWESIGGSISSDPAVVCWGPGRVDVFARGTDHRLQHRWFSNGWSADWEGLGGILTSAPDVCSWGPERLDVFARGTDGALWQLCFDRGWHPWQSLGGQIISDPAAVAPDVGKISVVATGLDFGLWIKNFG